MKNLFNFVKLDLLTIKPYLTDKKLLIYLFLAIILPYGNNEPISAIALALTFTMILGTYPFAISDANNLESLYVILGIKRKDVVFGRYITLFILYIGGAIVGSTIYVGLSLFMGTPILIKESLFLIVSVIAFMILGQCLQFPFFFKNGYLKSKALTYMPFALISISILLGSQLYNNGFKSIIVRVIEFIIRNSMHFAIVALLIVALIVFISYRSSLKYYMTKEL